MYSVAHTLEQLTPSLPPPLVGPAERSRLSVVASSLPAALTNWIYLECRLRSGAPRVDLILRVDRRGRDVLAGRNQIIPLDDALHTHSVWCGIRALAQEWSESSSLYRGVARIWLEFDLHPRDGALTNTMPAPGVFIEFSSSVHAHRRTDERVRVAMASLRAILPECLSADVVRNLRACWEVLPDYATIPYLGVFPARGSRAVRVCVAGLGETDLPMYLRSVRWPGSLDVLARTIATLCPPHLATRPRMAIVNLDVGRHILPSVGIEYLLSRASQLRGEITEAAFLDGLVESGLCSPAKRDALLAWPGISTRTMRHELWRSRVTRRVNHVKLSYSDGEPPEVKAYLSASHEFHPARSCSALAPIGMQPSTR